MSCLMKSLGVHPEDASYAERRYAPGSVPG
jgi:hypothetical protein